MLLLPFAALTPALAKYRDYGTWHDAHRWLGGWHYGRMFEVFNYGGLQGVRGGYLLQTSFFQAGVF